jgi:hypothetical protein
VHRLIANSLLVVILAGVFAPVAGALSQGPAHACCIRKAPHCHDGTQVETAISSGGCASHSCCRSLTVRQWAQAALLFNLTASRPSSPNLAIPEFSVGVSDINNTYLGRAPPAFLV